MKTEESQVTLIKLMADEGKTFARKSDGEVLGTVLYLGKFDVAENYEEIDQPIEEEINVTN